MPAPLIDLLRAGVPALLCLVVGIVVIRIVCRRPALRRLSFALSLIALTASVALFRTLVPAEATLLDPYLRFLLLFSLAYGAFKVVEVLVIDLLPGRHGSRQAPAILRDVVAAVVGGLILVVLLRASFGVDVAALVATSAALSIVLGLALQETLSNLFAGLALMLERPFEAGDWIQMGDLIGQVQEVSWRAVRLKLIRQEDFLVVPNSVEGRVEVSVEPPGGGPMQRLATLGASDYFGEMSLLTGAPRSATIRAVEETRLVVLRKEALRPLLVADPTVLERLSKTLARRQAEREDAIHRAAVSDYEGPGDDRAGQLLGRMRRFFGLMGGE